MLLIVKSQKCLLDEECEEKWPLAECVRSRCRCPPNTVRRRSQSNDFICLSVVDAVTGHEGPQLTCPLPEGAGYQVIYRNESQLVFCDYHASDSCPFGYECIQGLSFSYDSSMDGVCCPNLETTCSSPIFDHPDSGQLRRFGFDGQKCIAFSWDPERPSTSNNFRTKSHCESSCINRLAFPEI